MPKKKLTKAQVKRKLKTCMNSMYDLFLDKFAHGSQSNITTSPGKLMELQQKISRMFQQANRK
jgi:hypothetical protein